MAHPNTETGEHDRRRADRHWPDALFRVALVVWLVLGLAVIVRRMLAGESSVAHVVLVAWGVVVIVVLWFRLGPPRRRDRSDVIR